MLTIWGRENSNNVRKVLWCAAELELSYNHINAGGAFGKVNEERYRSLNPNGLVPLLQDDDFTLWESNTIVRYLAAKFGDAAFYPQDLQARASAEKWMDWTTSTLVAPFTIVFWGLVRTPPEQRDMAKITAAIATLEKHFDIVEHTLERQPYLSGESFGFGDIPLGSFAYAWFEMPIERRPRPNMERWYRQLCARPAYQRGVMTELT
ncbi:glutathione S-transferase [Serratia entomophila]|uniref:glutathione S-transferase n=1 Tax=Serratia entomophila TaxID=42906 RepID=UPI00217C5827|nr:glutathione S-transferase [Serratia entomophila]CAI1192118.1 Glutathione S-transferase GstB [Serratia entomophila]CAI1641524.1 Glutathione S-transferase GstB [Serratia entomophila]CAI1936091.1 Glutathione S-transferase GstB [Serratia entomophila]CAI1958567.1 Glutathione S-transferase GstB [Serratia entomophila]CAI2012139.1 Glutathione S-transferase GstB [Serratia entomophila]